MNEIDKQHCNGITYACVPRTQFSPKCLDVDIYIYHEQSSYHFPILSARLDWQDGLHIWQSECIGPFCWSAISAQLLLAMKEAKSMIDPTIYCAGEPE